MGAAFSSAYSQFFSGLSATSQAPPAVDGITFRQHADGERHTAGVPTVQPVSTDVAAAGEWGMSTQTRDTDGLGQWWCNVKTAGGYQRRSSDSQCAATDGPEADVQQMKARCMAITAA